MFTIKAVHDKVEELKRLLPNFQNNDPSYRDHAAYGIREIKLMRAFDIDTKTQHKAFFVFGRTAKQREELSQAGFRFNASVAMQMERNQIELSKETVTAFESLLRQRKANSDKVGLDHAGLNRELARKMRESIRDGMLAYLGEGGGVKYLACSSVPQKRYRYAPADYLAKQDKLPCRRLDSLCPACAMFGTAALDTERPDKENAKPSAIKWKISFHGGQDISACNPDDERLFKRIFQYVQGARDNKEFGRRLKEVSDVKDLAKLKLPDEKDIAKDFFRHPHIREFHDLLRFNVDSKSMSDLPVRYAANRENSYEWYGEVKKHGRKTPGKALFPPSEFDVDKALSG